MYICIHIWYGENIVLSSMNLQAKGAVIAFQFSPSYNSTISSSLSKCSISLLIICEKGQHILFFQLSMRNVRWIYLLFDHIWKLKSQSASSISIFSTLFAPFVCRFSLLEVASGQKNRPVARLNGLHTCPSPTEIKNCLSVIFEIC